MKRIAVETLTLNEISDLFRRSFEIAYPRAKGAIANKVKKLDKAKVSNHKWVQTYEIFKGAPTLIFTVKKYRLNPARLLVSVVVARPLKLL